MHARAHAPKHARPLARSHACMHARTKALVHLSAHAHTHEGARAYRGAHISKDACIRANAPTHACAHAQ
eukprot:14325173-Alexandrium_andersonii.AAC.1